MTVDGLATQRELNGAHGSVIGIHGLGERARVIVQLEDADVVEPVSFRAGNIRVVEPSDLAPSPFVIGGVAEATGLQNDVSLNGKRGRIAGVQMSQDGTICALVQFAAPHGKIMMHPSNCIPVSPQVQSLQVAIAEPDQQGPGPLNVRIEMQSEDTNDANHTTNTNTATATTPLEPQSSLLSGSTRFDDIMLTPDAAEKKDEPTLSERLAEQKPGAKLARRRPSGNKTTEPKTPATPATPETATAFSFIAAVPQAEPSPSSSPSSSSSESSSEESLPDLIPDMEAEFAQHMASATTATDTYEAQLLDDDAAPPSEESITARKEELKRHLASVEGILGRARGHMAELSAHHEEVYVSRSARVQTQLEGTKELEEEVKESLDENKAKVETAEEEVAKKTAELSGEKGDEQLKLIRLESEEETLHHRIEVVRRQLQRTAAEHSEAAAELAEMNKDRISFDSDLNPLLTSIAEADATITTLNTDLSNTESLLAASKATTQQKTQALTELDSEAQTVTEAAHIQRRAVLSRNRIRYATRNAIKNVGVEASKEATNKVKELQAAKVLLERKKREASKAKARIREIEMDPDMHEDVEALNAKKAKAAQARKFKEAKEVQDTILRIAQCKADIAALGDTITEVEGEAKALEERLPGLRAATVTAKLEASKHPAVIHLLNTSLEGYLLQDPDEALCQARAALSELTFKVITHEMASETVYDVRQDAAQRWRALLETELNTDK